MNIFSVFYLGPTKALCNQMLHEFNSNQFQPGIVTGDYSFNCNSNLLIMTPEILRCMIIGDDDKLKTLSWLIIDEVHLMSDLFRGFVYEDIISMLNCDVKLLLLSATIPNFKEVGVWIG